MGPSVILGGWPTRQFGRHWGRLRSIIGLCRYGNYVQVEVHNCAMLLRRHFTFHTFSVLSAYSAYRLVSFLHHIANFYGYNYLKTIRNHILEWDGHWHHLANTTERSMCGGNALMSEYFDHYIEVKRNWMKWNENSNTFKYSYSKRKTRPTPITILFIASC